MSEPNYGAINAHRRTVVAIVHSGRRSLPKREWARCTAHIWSIFKSSLCVEPDGAGLPCVIQTARELMVAL